MKKLLAIILALVFTLSAVAASTGGAIPKQPKAHSATQGTNKPNQPTQHCHDDIHTA